MKFLLLLIAAAVVALLARAFMSRWRMAARAEYIRHFTLPPGLYEKLQRKRPALTLKDCQLVSQALRQFFLAYLKSGRQFVSMPSQVTDDLWHEFILYTRSYEAFCKGAFGQFLHHSPAVVLGSNRQGNAGLRRAWWFVCKEENINPRRAARLPLLFAIDTKLGIADGFRYAVDCQGVKRASGNAGSDTATPYCAGDFSDSSIDGATDGWGDDAFGSDGSGGDGDGGCGGGGCGGGD